MAKSQRQQPTVNRAAPMAIFVSSDGAVERELSESGRLDIYVDGCPYRLAGATLSGKPVYCDDDHAVVLVSTVIETQETQPMSRFEWRGWRSDHRRYGIQLEHLVRTDSDRTVSLRATFAVKLNAEQAKQHLTARAARRLTSNLFGPVSPERYNALVASGVTLAIIVNGVDETKRCRFFDDTPGAKRAELYKRDSHGVKYFDPATGAAAIDIVTEFDVVVNKHDLATV